MQILTKYQLSFGCLGFINNVLYVMALSSSQDIATYFHKESLMSLVGFMLILPTSLIIILNSVCFLKISHRSRVIAMVCFNSIACILYEGVFSVFPSSDEYAFYICLGGSLVIGICQALGEGVIISFIKKFDSRCIAGWSSGTGLAGLLGSGSYLLLKSFNVSISTIFYCITPLEIVFAVLFIWLERNRPIIIDTKVYYKPIPQTQKLNEEEAEANSDRNDKDDKEMSINQEKIEGFNEIANKPLNIIDEKRNVVLNCTTIKPIFRKIWWSCLNIGLVFFFEYTVLVGFADVLTRQSNLPLNPNFFQKHAYQILSFMYQIGVSLSRSSMYCFKVSKWHILTLIQAFNFVGWFILAALTSGQVYAQFVWMVLVGLIGGCSYVNIYYFTLELNIELTNEQKQLAVNLIILSTDVFTTFATLFALLLSNTLFKQ